MENQQHLMNTIGPMYVEEQKQKAAAEQQVQPDATGNVTLKIS
jgi:hypothetical protein